MQQLKSNEYVKIDGDRFDILKFILAVLVMGLHFDYCYPLQSLFRLAVPLFFMMTSYFFFLKQNSLDSYILKKRELKRYCKRILMLYLFWFVLLLPLTFIYQGWEKHLNSGFILYLMKSFLFGSTFKASWFLIASLISITLVWYLSSRVKPAVLFAIGIILYLFCCMSTNYYYLCARIPYFSEFHHEYVSIFNDPYNSFPVALIFVIIGKYLADHSIYVSNKCLFGLIVVLFVVYFCEFYFVWKNRFALSGDSFFSLLPLSIAVFMIIGQNHVNTTIDAKKLRKYSTIIFCSHFTLGTPVLHFIKSSFPSCEAFKCDIHVLLTFVITLVICILLSEFLIWLEKKEYFKWVRYSH